MKKYTINHQNLFSDEEDDFIRKHYLTMSDAEIARHLGHTTGSVKQRRLSVLLLARPMVKDHANTIRKMAWEGYTIQQIASTIGFSPSAVHHFCKKNGLHVAIRRIHQNPDK